MPKAPTISDVATRAGVGVSSAARVLSGNGYAGATTREKVLAAAQELGYVPNRIARSLREGNTRLIGLLTADVENSFYSTVAKHVELVLKEHGYHVVLCNDNDDPKQEAEYLALLEELGVDGLIVTPTPQNRRLLERLQRKGVVIVQIDRRVPGLKADAVLTDNEKASCSAVTFLLDRGHTRIGMLAGPRRVSTGKERYLGYERALAQRGVPLQAELVRHGSFRRDHAISDANDLIMSRSRPTALFAANNILAEACVLALRDRGHRIPEDMSLVAFDDMPWMRMMTPALTTVRQPIAEMAVSASQLLLERLREVPDRPTTVVFDTELVVRESVHPNASRSKQ